MFGCRALVRFPTLFGSRTFATQPVNSQAAFEAAFDSSRKQLLYFTAGWCGPCQRVAPQVEALSDDPAAPAILKIDLDSCQEAAEKFSIRAVPTFVLVESGQEKSRVEGADVEKVKKLL